MAGGLTISTLNDSSGVLATQNGMSGIAKAWVNFAGSTGSIRASFNVSSVTRNGVGDYTINFTTAMPDTNYTVLLAARSAGSPQTATPAYDVTNTTTAIRIYSFVTTSGSQTDSTYVLFGAFR